MSKSNVKSLENVRESKLVTEIRELLAADEEMSSLLLTATKRAIRLGELFTQAKELAGHGNWLMWLEDHGFVERTAQKYMQAFEGTKSAQHADMPPPQTIKDAVDRAPKKERAAPAPQPKPDPINEDCQFVISCLDPDNAPNGMKENFRKAIEIMNNLMKRFSGK